MYGILKVSVVGSISSWIIPKAVKMVAIASLRGARYLGLDLRGFDHPLIARCGTAAAHRLLRGWLNSRD